MSVFKNRIIIDNSEGKLNKTQEAVFNEMIEPAVAVREDGDEMHQVITMLNGDEYYFDSYRFIYPIKTKEYTEVINNNVGPGEIVSASTYGKNMIRVDHYIDDRKMVRTLYLLPEGIENIGAFLLQVSSLDPEIIGKLTKVSEVTFIKKSDMILGYDEQGNNFYRRQATTSFYDDTLLAVVDYMNIEDKKRRNIL